MMKIGKDLMVIFEQPNHNYDSIDFLKTLDLSELKTIRVTENLFFRKNSMNF